MKHFFLIGLLLAFARLVPGYGQGVSPRKVAGEIVDGAGKPVPFATVALLNPKDSVIVKGVVTDNGGAYTFENVAPGRYTIAASSIGFAKAYSPGFSVEAGDPEAVVRIAPLTLREDVQTLNEVVVKGEKDFIEQKIDRTVINVQSSLVSTGGNALEVLTRAPGVVVTQDVIQLKGKAGVLILIDGKQTYLSGGDVANLLRNMQSSNIDKIEIIANPPARYDAEGDAGIINIITKKGEAEGLKGSVQGGAGYGRYPKYNGSMNLNYRAGRFNFYVSGSSNYNKTYDRYTTVKNVYFRDDLTTLDRDFLLTPTTHNSTVKVGADLYLDGKNTVGFFSNLYLNSNNTAVTSRTDLRSNYAPGIDSSTLMSNPSRSWWRNNNYNVYYKRVFSRAELNLDVDYSRFHSQIRDNIVAQNYDAAQEILGDPYQLRSYIPITIQIKSAKADYAFTFNDKSKLDVGIKASEVSSDNSANFDFFQYQEQTWMSDLGKTNQFQYRENINAAYVIFNRKFKDLEVQAGLRAEQTIARSNSVTLDQQVNRNYLNFFPNLSVLKKLSEKQNLNFIYSRRITRPNYRRLNPFTYYQDIYTSHEGNPYLNPELTHSLQLAYLVNKVYVSLGYSQTRNAMTFVPEQNDSTKVTTYRVINLNSYRNYSLNLTVPLTITPWWSANNNFNTYYNHFQSYYLERDLDQRQLAFNASTSHTFSLPAGVKAEIFASYSSPTTSGLQNFQSNASVDMGVQKSFFNDKANVRLRVTDVFKTTRFKYYTRYENMDIQFLSLWETRTVNFTFSYQFGNAKIKALKERSGIESESGRIH